MNMRIDHAYAKVIFDRYTFQVVVLAPWPVHCWCTWLAVTVYTGVDEPSL